MKLISILCLLFLNFSFGNSETKVNTTNLLTNDTLFEITQNSFKESQLIGKWYFLSKDNDKKTKLENLTEGKSLSIKKNNKYKSEIFKKKEQGEWSFNEKSQILIFEKQSEKTEWKVHNLNEFGMVLINLATNEKWMFALAN